MFCCRKDPNDHPAHYQITIGENNIIDGIQSDNSVKTTRYTLWNFIPLMIYEQFKRVANFYFLLVAILSLTPWSPLEPFFQIFPLCFVLAVSMIKSGIEDLLRFANDKKYNSIKYQVWKNNQFHNTESHLIKPGDIVKLSSGVEMPSDILILATSEHGNICYANEVNLNGETAIKQRKALDVFANTPENDASQIHGKFTIPWPNKDLGQLNGSIEVDGQQHGFSMKNCILRGVFLKHTEWIIGTVLYSGHDTRIIQNQRHPPHKTSQLEKQLNKFMALDFALNIILCIVFASIAQHCETTLKFQWVSKEEPSAWSWCTSFVAYAILLSYMIPISMYVSLEFGRFFQRWTFSSDLGMYMPGLGFCRPNNSNLNEELGMIDHVFSDKTGTLTENKMKVVKISARGNIFDVDEDNIDRVRPLIGQNRELTEMVSALGLCHSVIITQAGYSSESPDEEALVDHAKNLGVSLTGRVPEESISIQLGEKEHTFQQLGLIEFNSDRKRMSIIVRSSNNQIILYTKGADSIMLDLMSQEEDRALIEATQQQVDAFACDGLRTLVYGWRLVSEEEYAQWSSMMKEAETDLENREQRVAEVGASIEKDLLLLGAVAIEDELQDQVPETVNYLSLMGIKFWVLTGDKKQTAVSIARSTSVITLGSTVFEMDDISQKDQIISDIPNAKNPVMIIAPDALVQWIDNEPLSFVEVGDQCKSVVCYRMSPFLKSRVVDVMRSNTSRVCLAIGDGANDVNMIQTAHVGVGIIGREGRQAANNSDFAIPRFKHLKRLLCCHGRISVVRISGLILYMIYKNLLLIFPQLYFMYFTHASPTTVYNGFLLSTYNLLWTIFPPVEFCWFEIDVSFKSMMTYPFIYRESKAGRYLSWWRFILEFLNAVYQSLLIFYFCCYLPSKTIASGKGYTDNFYSMGFIMFTCIMLTANFQLIVRSHHWNVFMCLSVVLSVLCFFLLLLPYGSFDSLLPDIFYVPQMMITEPFSYLTIFYTVFVSLVPEILFRYLKGLWSPSYTRIIRELEVIEENQAKRHLVSVQ